MSSKSISIWTLIAIAICIGVCFHWPAFVSIAQESGKAKATTEDESMLVALGTNSNREIPESSGLARSKFVEDAIWTLNDSGNGNQLYLLKHNGKMLAKLKLGTAKNLDWEAMSRFEMDDRSYLMVGDVGDNAKNRKGCQLLLVPEPDVSKELGDKPIEKSSQPIEFNFTYEDKAKNCEAIAVDSLGKQIWLVEKVYYNSRQKEPPGIYVLPLSVKKPDAPLVAKRIADFPIRNVTGMDFSPDGKYLIIRNYINAHLYTRTGDQTWQDVVKNTKPKAVVLPLQRQGEAVCFSADSKSLIITSELVRQMIWQVGLEQYFPKTEEK